MVKIWFLLEFNPGIGKSHYSTAVHYYLMVLLKYSSAS